ncbi:hypothetical protein ASE04_09625 [Rhizobium sp. Root708]|uniref:hypothetical protein n=1 Tax=Rhizobium sp. Root708 TaxID=1736592 RepID=UPI0006FE58D2|nr:hypothetical protein [Rhizobium sp. Root708]KRB51783.1 hypothetical protein ASE04_09625 [Rhizobium sp. Root708]
MGLLALLVALTIDPIRIAAVLLCVAFICKTYAPGSRVLVTVISLALIAGLITFLVETMHVIPASAAEIAVKFAFGLIANAIIAGIAFGCIKLFSGRRQQHR